MEGAISGSGQAAVRIGCVMAALLPPKVVAGICGKYYRYLIDHFSFLKYSFIKPIASLLMSGSLLTLYATYVAWQ